MATGDTVEIELSLTRDEAWALAQLCKRFGYQHATELATPCERDAILEAVISTSRALAKAGYAPR
jgi:hypothetical protein